MLPSQGTRGTAMLRILRCWPHRVRSGNPKRVLGQVGGAWWYVMRPELSAIQHKHRPAHTSQPTAYHPLHSCMQHALETLCSHTALDCSFRPGCTTQRVPPHTSNPIHPHPHSHATLTAATHRCHR